MDNTAVATTDQASQDSTQEASEEAVQGSQDTYVSPQDEVEKSTHPVVQGFNRLPIVRQAALVIGGALVLVFCVMLIIWSQEPTFKPLITRMQDHNAQDIVSILQREGIAFQIDPTTQILMVEAADLHKARMKLAAASLIDDKTVGFELLDKDTALGTSQFIESARYRRGLEGELARTIASVKAIRNARVHLAVPKQSVFVRDTRKASASVFVELYAGSSLSKNQVEAIVNLVATSISQMNKADVSIVDQHGNLLSKIEDEKSQDVLAQKQLQYTQKVEQSIREAVNGILKPVLGSDNYQAEVAADIDFTLVEQTEELYNPDLIALRSEQLLNEEKVNQVEGGIPGALSNQPPKDATSPEQATGEAGGAQTPLNKRSESTRNYEVDRTLSYKQQQVGKIQRLTVAVVVNDKKVVNDAGETTYEPWSEQDLQRFETLVKDAVGFNAARGDSVNVVNSMFLGTSEHLAEPEFWRQPWFWEIMKQVLAGLFVLVLIFGVIRPTIKSIVNKGKEDDEAALLSELEDAEAGLEGESVTLQGMDEYLLPGASQSYEMQLEALKNLIAEDPARVAQVVISWVNDDA